MAREILIVEPHEGLRAALYHAIRDALPDALVLEAINSAQALELARLCAPALIIIDRMLRDAESLGLGAELLRLCPQSRVVMLAHEDGSGFHEQARAAGISACVAKDRLHTDLVPALVKLLQAPPV